MRAKDVVINEAYCVVVPRGTSKRPLKATALRTDAPFPTEKGRRGMKITGIEVRWEESRGEAGRYGSVVHGEVEVVLSRHVERPWTTKDDEARERQAQHKAELEALGALLTSAGIPERTRDERTMVVGEEGRRIYGAKHWPGHLVRSDGSVIIDRVVLEPWLKAVVAQTGGVHVEIEPIVSEF